MSRAPSIQLYLRDWVDDLDLASCSWQAQGCWMRVLAKLHQSDEYGVLRWPLKQIAQTAGVPLKFLRELAQKNVLKGSDNFADDFVHIPAHAGASGDPVVLVAANGGCCWFSKRFVLDSWRRSARGGATRFAAKAKPTGSPTRAVGDPVGDESGDGPAFAFAFASKVDSSKQADSSIQRADDLARALQECGYTDCSGGVPELIEARAAGLTYAELRAVAALDKCAGKPVAYVVATALGKRDDQAKRAGGESSRHDGSPPLDDSRKRLIQQLHDLDDRELTARNDHRLGILTEDSLAAKLAGIAAQRQALNAEARP